jgi:DNA (cytosine-5)-methyltransferase 1
MAAYYNENDPKAAAWLRELIKARLIADGEVDERSITDVQPGDLAGFVQCHFFAGIGGWSYALRLAGWPDEREVWTGSCPCQPFSIAGAQLGGADARDLWPAWFRLIRECRPHVVFGEQVESAIAHGWLDRLCDDMEGEDYACGPVGVPAAGVGAFHIRNRLWFVAHSMRESGQRRAGSFSRAQTQGGGARELDGHRVDGPANGGEVGELADATRRDLGRHGREPRGTTDARGGEAWPADGHAAGSAGGMGNAEGIGRERGPDYEDERWREQSPRHPGEGFWSDAEWLYCADGKWRPVEPGTFPLAHGIPARVGRLRGYGNAINPWVAKEVIAAYMEICEVADR